jgi:hypothetical protein
MGMVLSLGAITEPLVRRRQYAARDGFPRSKFTTKRKM